MEQLESREQLRQRARQSLDEERNVQVWEKVYLMESGFPWNFCPNAHM